MTETQKRVVIWVAASVFLVILADYLPSFTVMFVLLILASVILMNSQDIVQFMSQL